MSDAVRAKLVLGWCRPAALMGASKGEKASDTTAAISSNATRL